jgi:ferritin-like metal-binding protein YciE
MPDARRGFRPSLLSSGKIDGGGACIKKRRVNLSTRFAIFQMGRLATETGWMLYFISRSAMGGSWPASCEGGLPMSELNTIEDLLAHSVMDLYSAETQLVEALPKMAAAATEPALIEAFTSHLEETKVHVVRLEKIADLLGVSPFGLTCQAMKGLLKEGQETIEEEAEPSIKDLALITAAQKVEHYEISGYGSARALAEALANQEVLGILQTTLEEEAGADKILTALAAKIVGGAPTAG